MYSDKDGTSPEKEAEMELGKYAGAAIGKLMELINGEYRFTIRKIADMVFWFGISTVVVIGVCAVFAILGNIGILLIGIGTLLLIPYCFLKFLDDEEETRQKWPTYSNLPTRVMCIILFLVGLTCIMLFFWYLQ